MTLDEAILYAKEQTEVFGGTHKEFLENVMEWLEEYKKLKENSFFNFDSPVTRVDKKSYNKAIDEFVEKICEKYTEEESKGNYKQYCVNIKQEIADIAEQMKAGE